MNPAFRILIRASLAALLLPASPRLAAAQTVPGSGPSGPGASASRDSRPPWEPDDAAPAPAAPVNAPGPGGSATRGFEPDPAAAASRSDSAPEAAPGVGVSVGPLDFSLHGYFRAPLRFSFRARSNGGYDIHSPWLVDDDYFNSGFAYTRLQEQDWTELYLGVSSKYLTADVVLMGSLFSDWAQPLIGSQLGIAQGFLTFHWESSGPRLRFKVQVKGGSFWDRFGWLENYDTYMFGRTHQMGGQVKLEWSGEKLTFWLLQGVGAHLENLDANQGLTMLNYLYSGLRYGALVEGGFYFLDARTQDERQLSQIVDASMQVYGADFRLNTALLGRLYLAGSIIKASESNFLGPAIEVLHAYGGNGLTENYFGTQSSQNGTGSLWSVGLEHNYSFRALLTRVLPAAAWDRILRGGDVSLKWFGLLTYVESAQVSTDPTINKDGIVYFKWGGEVAWQPLSFLGVSLRYDRVILNIQDDQNSFRLITPRISLFTHHVMGAQIFLQYSRYFYGDRVLLRPGQVPLETMPDTNAVKLQAQIAF